MRNRFLIASIILVFSNHVGADASREPQAAPGGSPRAVVTETEHDFGVVRQGERLAHTFVIHNEGAAPLTISRIDLSLPGTKTRFRKTVPPSESAQIVMEWDTSTVQGEFEAQAVVHLNDPLQPNVSLTLKAVVKSAIEFVPFPEMFFSAYHGETPERSVRVINNEARPLDVTGVETPSGHFDVHVETVRSGFEYDVRVAVRPDVALGRYPSEPIYLHTGDPARPRLQLLANLLIKPDFYAAPEEANFGTVGADALAAQPQFVDWTTQTLTLTNRQGPVEIERIESDVAALQVTRTPSSGASQRIRLDLSLAPDRLERGTFFGHLRVFTTDPTTPVLIIPVRGEVR